MASYEETLNKLLGKYNLKKKEEEEKKEETKPSSPTKSGSGTAYNDRLSKLVDKYLVSSMSSQDASEWYNNAHSLISRLSESSNDYQTYTNSADIEEVRSLLDSSLEFRKYLLSNRGKLEKYDELYKGYSQLKSALEGVIKANNYYSQFKDEEDYNYQKQVADIYNMSATEVEEKLNKVSYYDSDYQLAFELSQTMMPYSKEYALQDGFTEEEWNDIDRKRKYLGEKYGFDLYADIYANTEILNKIMAKTEAIKNDASVAYTTKDGEKITWQNLYAQKKRSENLESLSAVSKNSDFITGSQFQSSKLADDDWWGNLTSRYGMGYADLTHDYINGDDAFVGQVHTKHDLYNFSSNPANAAPDEFHKGYHLLNDDERAVYNYYYNTQGKEKAQEYLDALEETLQARLAAEYFDEFNDNIFEEYVFGAYAGFDQFVSGIENLFSTEDYIPPSASQITSGMIREDLADDGVKLPEWMGGASIGQIGYDAINTTANMLPSILAGSIPVVGQVAGATLLSASAAGNAKAEMLRLGYSKEQANTYGLLVGASEGLLQYALGGISKLGGKVTNNAISKLISGIDNGFARTAIKVGGNMLSEGLEESLQSIIEPVLKSIVTGEELEAIDWGEVVYSGLLGMVTAGVLEGPSTIAGEVNTYQQGKVLKGDLAALDRLTKLGSTMSADSVAFQLAGKVDANTGAYTIGRLLNEVGASLSEANKADIVKSLEQKGMRTEDAKTISKWLGRVVDGETFSNKQVAMIESNDVLAQTLVDVLINPNSTVWQRQGTYNELYELANAKVEKSKGAKTTTSTTQASPTETKAVPVTENSTAKENATEGKNAVSESGKTTHNGVEVKISDIASIENGVVKLKLDSGEEVDMDEVEFATEEEGLLYETIIDKDIDTARDIVEAFKIAKNAPLATPQTLDTFIPGFNEAHTYGRLGIPQETLARDGMFSKSLLEAQRKIAYNRGAINALSEVKAKQAEINKKKAEASENSKKAKPKKGNVSFEDGVTATTKNEKSAVKLAKVLSKAIGIDIVFYDARTTSDPHGKGANGYYDEATNTIHLDLQKAHNDTKTIAFSLSHEVTHFIKKWSPEKFDTLAKFLMEQYGEHGVDVATMLSNKMAELDTDADTAFEEMVCDAMETMLLDSNAVVKLMKLRETDLTLFEKLKMHILELLNKLREAYRSLGYETTTDEAKALLEMTDVLEKFYALFEDAAVDATESFGAVGTLNTESVSVSEDGTVRLQMKQYQQTGRATLLNYLREQYGEQDANDLILTIDNIYDTLVEFKNDEALSVFGNWQDTEVELDENGHPIFTTSIKNGDYELNQDFSRVCKKRRQLDFVLNMLAEDPAFEASHLTKQDFVKINKAIKAHGFEIACALCFVDSKRFRQAEWADSFANTWNDILNAVVKDGSKLTPFNFATKNPNLADDGIEIDTSKAVTYRKWSDGREDVKNRRTYESFEQMLSKDDEGKWLEGNTNVRTIATLIRDNPELRHTFRGADIIASKGFDTIQRLAPGIRSILDGWGGSSVPKPSSNDTSYDNSIINMSGYNKKTAYAMGGVRMNSFSDFMAHMFFDYCQAFADLSAKELPSQAYTKELTYVRFFGRSGQKINMSGIAAIRDDALPTTASKGVTKAEAEANEKIEKMVAGLDVSRLLEHLNKDIHQLTEADVEQFLDMCDYVWADESINMKHATLLQTGILYDKLSESKVEECYELLKAGEIEQALKVAGEENVDREYAKNCGTIVVGVSDAHIRKLLRDPTVRMVIPYHKSGLNPVIARELRISAYNDYTLAQTTGVKRKGAKATDKIGSTAIKDAYGLKDFAFYDWFGKTIDGKLYDGKATADKYLEWCEKGYYDENVGDYVYYTTKGDGYILAKEFHKKATIVPKFDAFMGEENYYKVLEDFDCYDTITGEHSAQGAVDFLRNGLPSDYKDVLSTALKEEQKVSDDFRDHLDNKGLKEEVMGIVKARGYSPSEKTDTDSGIHRQAKALQRKDPTKLKETDLIDLLQYSKDKLFTDGSYIPVRINTPQILIAFAKEKGYTLENIPLAMSVYKARQAVSSVEEWDGNPKDTPHNLKPQEVVDIIRAMDNPSYLVFQTKNERFAEIVKFGKEKEKAYAVIDFYDVNKNAEIMNGYKGGKYNILVTIYPSEDAQALKDYLKDKRNKVMTGEEMKKKGLSQRGLGSYVPALLNDSPFFEDIIAEEKPAVKKQLKKTSDTDYLDAVNRGDMETAQKMVDEAASEAGYIKLFYHGTPNGDFTKFNTHGKPIWITASKEYAEMYSKDENPKSYKEDERVMPLYAKMENRLDITSVSTIQYAFDDYNHRNPSSELKRLADVVGEDVSVLAKIGRKNNATYLYHVINTADFANTIREKGYDSIKQSEYGNIAFGVLDPSQLKSAYVATYNKKKVIPLSERFNADNDDIRYQKKQLSNRTLLANALEATAQNEIEKNKLAQYKNKIALIESEQAKLDEIKKQANELRFTKGRSAEETKKMRSLDFEANQIANRINTYDRQLLNLESTAALKNVLQREKELARKKEAQRGKEALAKQREKEAEKTRVLLERASESRKKGIEGRKKTEMRRKIRKLVKELNSLFKNGTKKRNVKEEMKDTVATSLTLAEVLFNDDITNKDIARLGVESITERERGLLDEYKVTLDSIDAIDSQIEALEKEERPKEERYKLTNDLNGAKGKLKNKISKLNGELSDLFERERVRLHRSTVDAIIDNLVSEYSKLKDSENGYIKNAYSEAMETRLIALKESLKGAIAKDMDIYQLSELYDAFKMVAHMVRTANGLFIEGRTEDLMTYVSNVQGEIYEVTTKQKDRGVVADSVANFLNEFSWNELRPVDAVERLGSRTFEKLFWDVVHAMDVAARDITEAGEVIAEAREKYGYSKWKMELADTSFKTIDGLTFKPSLADKLSIYAYSQREQAGDHMTEGGFTYDTGRTYKETVKNGKIEKTYVRRKLSDTYRLSKEDISKIIASLSKEQRAYVDAILPYLTSLGQKGNEVSMTLYGIELFGEKVYFPLQSSKDYLSSTTQTLGATPTMASLANSGFTKQTKPHARNPIVLRAFDDVVLEHIEKMSNYHALVIPIENMRRVFDNIGRETEGMPISTKALIGSRFGEGAQKYFEQWITDLNGGVTPSGAKNILGKLFSRAKGMSVSANLSVVAQQYFSIIRAMEIVDPKYFTPFLNSEAKKTDIKQYDELRKYAPIAIIKEMGGFDVGSRGRVKDYIGYKGARKDAKYINKKIDDIAMWGAGKMDELGWVTIWKAVKAEVASEQKLTPGTDKFYEACRVRFTEVVTKTQVFDSVVSRSGYMRSQHDAVKYATSFMGEPTAIVGRYFVSGLNLVRAFKSRDTAKMKSAGLRLGRTATIMAASMVLGNLAKSLVYAGRDDEEDEAFLEKWMRNFGSAIASDLNPLNSLPFTRDVVSIIEGWDVERPDMTLIADMVTAVKKMTDGDITFDDSLNLVGSVGNFFGKPLKNVIREIKSVINVVGDVFDDVHPTDMGGAFTEGFTGIERSKTESLYLAIINGDKGKIEAIKATYKTDSAYESARRTALTENDPRIQEAVMANIEGNSKKRVSIVLEIKGEGNFTQDEIVMAINNATTNFNTKVKAALTAKANGNTAEHDKIVKELREKYPKDFVEKMLGETKLEEPETEDKEIGLYEIEDYYTAILNGDRVTANTAYKELISEKLAEGYIQSEAEDAIATSFSNEVKKAYMDGYITRSKAITLLTNYGGGDRGETDVKKWDFEIKHDLAWSERVRGYRLGLISKSELISAVMDIEGETRTAAEEYIRFLDLEMDYPALDIDASDAKNYFKYAEPANINIEVYLDYKTQTKGLEGDKDENGKTISGSKKAKVMKVINSLPITSAQKDALYYAEGWSASTLYEAPWH